MWELDYKEDWALKYWCFWTVVLEKTLESLLACKEIKLVNPKGNQFWIFITETIVDAVAPIFWLPDERSNSMKNTLMLGKIEGKRRRGWQRIRWLDGITDLMDRGFSKVLKESFPRQVNKKFRVPQGERGLEFSRKKKGQTFFLLHSLRLYNNNISCLRTVSGLNLLANSVILKCKVRE